MVFKKFFLLVCLILPCTVHAFSVSSLFQRPSKPSLGASLGAHSEAPGVVEILKPSEYQRVLAISDVHGMYPELLALLRAAQLIDANRNWVGGRSLLVVIGDSIDKGPQSVEVIDLWKDLQPQAKASGGMLIHLLGNHEAEFLADPHNRKTEAFSSELQQKGIPIEEFTDPKYPRAQFIRSMPVAAQIGKWLFCHSGFYPETSWTAFKADASQVIGAGDYHAELLSSQDSILEAKKWDKDPEEREELESRLESNGFVGVVFGHQPKALKIEGESGQSRDGRLIKIDNGMAPQAGAHPGSILVFDHPEDLERDDLPCVETMDSTGVRHKLTKERKKR